MQKKTESREVERIALKDGVIYQGGLRSLVKSLDAALLIASKRKDISPFASVALGTLQGRPCAVATDNASMVVHFLDAATAPTLTGKREFVCAAVIPRDECKLLKAVANALPSTFVGRVVSDGNRLTVLDAEKPKAPPRVGLDGLDVAKYPPIHRVLSPSKQPDLPVPVYAAAELYSRVCESLRKHHAAVSSESADVCSVHAMYGGERDQIFVHSEYSLGVVMPLVTRGTCDRLAFGRAFFAQKAVK